MLSGRYHAPLPPCQERRKQPLSSVGHAVITLQVFPQNRAQKMRRSSEVPNSNEVWLYGLPPLTDVASLREARRSFPSLFVDRGLRGASKVPRRFLLRGLDMSILNALRFLALAGQLSSLKQKSAGNHDELAFGLGRPRRTPTRVKRRNHGWRSSPSSRALSGELCQILPRTKNGKGSGITSIVTLGRTARTLFIVKMFSVVVAVAVHTCRIK